MVVPLLLGAIVNTFFGNVLWSASDDTFTTYPWKSGAIPILAVFIFYNATTTNPKKTGAMVHRGMFIMTVKVGVGIVIGLVCGTLFGEKGFLGPFTLTIVGALTNSSDGLCTTLAGEYGDAANVGAVSILSINDGPFFTTAALGTVGVARIPVSIPTGCIIPAIVECIPGNLDEDIRKLREPGATMLIPFFTFPLRAGLNIMGLLKAGGSGILLGVACTLITGLVGYLIYRPLCMDHPKTGGAIGAAADNTAATSASIIAVDATLLAVAEAAAVQITTAIIVTVILCSVLISYLRKIEAYKRGR